MTDNADKTFEEFWNVAQAAGQLQAIHDIYGALQTLEGPALGEWLEKYLDAVKQDFVKKATKYQMTHAADLPNIKEVSNS